MMNKCKIPKNISHLDQRAQHSMCPKPDAPNGMEAD